MNKKRETVCIFIFLINIFFPLSLYSIESNDRERLVFDNAFYKKLYHMPALTRNKFFEKKINCLIVSQGIIHLIEKKKGYDKNFRIICESTESKQYHMIVYYYIYFNKRNTRMMLKKNFKFEFVGQLMNYAAYTTMKNAFIIDVVLQKGAIIID